MDGVAKTSLLTAAMRAAESQRGDALFVDPYAETLAGAEGMDLRERAIAASGDQPAIAIRTAYIDSRVMAATRDGVRQIVLLAAGMDTRAYRLPLPKETKVFELDQPEVISYKEEKLKSDTPLCNLKRVAVDLREDWQDQLIQAGFKKNERTVWMVEGLLMYLEEAQVRTLLSRINALADPGDFLLLDILSRTLLEVPHMKAQLEFLSSLGAPWKFGVNDPKSFFAEYGWNVTLNQPGDFAPSRWPFPSVPLGVPNVPRGYYVEARKK